MHTPIQFPLLANYLVVFLFLKMFLNAYTCLLVLLLDFVNQMIHIHIVYNILKIRMTCNYIFTLYNFTCLIIYQIQVIVMFLVFVIFYHFVRFSLFHLLYFQV